MGACSSSLSLKLNLISVKCFILHCLFFNVSKKSDVFVKRDTTF